MLRQLARRCHGLDLCAASSSALRRLPSLSAFTFCSRAAPDAAAAEVLSPEPVTNASPRKGDKRRSGKQQPSLSPELLPQVAIVGRPNVGKSALFNRLVQRRAALEEARRAVQVHNTPEGHVTRDYKEGVARLADLDFRCIDTSGLEPFMAAATLQARATQLTLRVLQTSDLALLLLDGRAGIGTEDEALTRWLRSNVQTPLVLVANKCEKGGRNSAVEDVLTEATRLGLGEPVAISAATGDGMAELYSAIQPAVEAGLWRAREDPAEAQEAAAAGHRTIALTLMGLPNVGKSTLSNRLVGKERSLTGPEPGLTRDVVRGTFMWDNYRIEMQDTAGRMRRNRLQQYDDAEGAVAAKTLAQGSRSMQLAQVVALLVDSAQILAAGTLSRAEIAIVASIVEEGRSLVVVANKADTLPPKQRHQVIELLIEKLKQHAPEVTGVPILAASALTGAGVDKLMPAVTAAHDIWERRVPTSRLNRWLAEMVAEFTGGGGTAKELAKIRYITQVKSRPPTFAVFTRTDDLSERVRKQLVNRVRQEFHFAGVPIRMLIRPGREHDKKKKKRPRAAPSKVAAAA